LRFAKLLLLLPFLFATSSKEQEGREGKGKKETVCLFFIPKVSPSFSFPRLELKEISFLSHIFETLSLTIF
jgi:hypothetical protein